MQIAILSVVPLLSIQPLSSLEGLCVPLKGSSQRMPLASLRERVALQWRDLVEDYGIHLHLDIICGCSEALTRELAFASLGSLDGEEL